MDESNEAADMQINDSVVWQFVGGEQKRDSCWKQR